MKGRPTKTRAENVRPSEDEIRTWIAEAAYYRAERRGFSPGMEIDDWMAAEAEVLARTRTGQLRI